MIPALERQVAYAAALLASCRIVQIFLIAGEAGQCKQTLMERGWVDGREAGGISLYTGRKRSHCWRYPAPHPQVRKGPL